VSASTDSVDPSAFKILNQPDYIFLCGGRLDDFEYSLRAHFHRDKVQKNPALSKRVQLAEKADEWYQSRKLFDDLLELEEHLAGLSACVLLFVESPGAIAEFGAFSQMELLKDKLVVVIEDSYFRQQSFIRNGLVEHARRLRPDSVLSYPWLSPPTGDSSTKIDPAGASDTLDEIEREVEEIIKKKPKTTTFRKNDHGHLMLLIADIVTLNVIILQQEIQAIIAGLGIPIKIQELRKYLFLLERLDLISTGRYGSVDYYMNRTGAPEYVTYARSKHTDRSRLRMLLREDLPLSDEKKKAFNALTRPARGVAP
jgi:hypothetical protein